MVLVFDMVLTLRFLGALISELSNQEAILLSKYVVWDSKMPREFVSGPVCFSIGILVLGELLVGIVFLGMWK